MPFEMPTDMTGFWEKAAKRARRLKRPPSRKCKRTRGSSETDGRSEGAPGRKSVPKDIVSNIDADLASPQVMDEPMKKRRKTDGFTDSPSTKRDLEERSGLGGAPTRAQPQSAASDPRTTATEHAALGVRSLADVYMSCLLDGNR